MINAGSQIVDLPYWEMAEYWAGFYCQSKSSHFYQENIEDKIHFLTAIGGKGMTLGPGISEKNIEQIFC